MTPAAPTRRCEGEFTLNAPASVRLVRFTGNFGIPTPDKSATRTYTGLLRHMDENRVTKAYDLE